MDLQQRQARALSALLLLLALCLAALPAAARTAQGRMLSGVVTHVTDGDTLWVRTSAHAEPRKVRLQGVDAPEACQSGGAQAMAALQAHVLGQTVQLQGRAHDDYGRMLARVSLRGEDVGAWLVASGHAWSYGWRGRHGPYAAEMQQAQAARRGLWAQAAIEPRVFRRQHGSCRH